MARRVNQESVWVKKGRRVKRARKALLGLKARKVPRDQRDRPDLGDPKGIPGNLELMDYLDRKGKPGWKVLRVEQDPRAIEDCEDLTAVLDFRAHRVKRISDSM